MKKNLLILCIFFSHNLFSKPETHNNKVVSISIPKCGTHLLLKCLTLFDIKGLSYNYNYAIKKSSQDLAHIRELNKKNPPLNYTGTCDIKTMGPLPQGTISRMEKLVTQKLFWTHWPHTKEFEKYLQDHTYANFLILRDPRDMVVSFAFMVQKRPTGHEAYPEINLENIIIDLITGKKEHYLPWGVEIQETYPILWDLGLYNFYQQYLPWTNAKNFLLIKFEDLIGTAGGSTDEKQLETVIKIAQHLKINLTPEKNYEIAQKLFGNTWTFREGKIGGWKNYFSPKIKEIFKQDAQLLKLLIDLGYEKDTTW